MVHQSVIQARLDNLGVKLSRWYKPELKELSLILMDNEEIVLVVAGRYYGGYALLVATGQRLLLIDKKTMFMSMEDIRYDMISAINYSSRLFDSTILISTMNKQHRFTSVKHKTQMRSLTIYAQRRVMEIRQPQSTQDLARELDDSPSDFRYSQGEIDDVSSIGEISSQLPTSVIVAPTRGISTHLRLVGTAAIRGAHLSAINPYAHSSLTIKRTWSGLGRSVPAIPEQNALF